MKIKIFISIFFLMGLSSKSFADCFAQTRCRGRANFTISCSAYGAGSFCYDSPGVLVTCEGKNGFNGQHGVFTEHCSDYESLEDHAPASGELEIN